MFNSSELNTYEFGGSRHIILSFTVAKNPVPQPTVPWSKPTEPRIAWSKPAAAPTVPWSKPTEPATAWTPPAGSLWTLNGVPMDGSAMFGGRQIGLISWSKSTEPTTPWT